MFTPLLTDNKAHIYSHLVFAANGSCVDTTIIDGRIVMQGRQLTLVDEAEMRAGGERGIPPGPGAGGRGLRQRMRTLVRGGTVVALGQAGLSSTTVP